MSDTHPTDVSSSHPNENPSEALVSMLKMEIPNQEITLFTGELIWHGEQRVFPLQGRIFYRWLPEPALCFEGEASDWIPGNFNNCLLEVQKEQWRFRASPNSYNGGRVNGLIMEGIFGNSEAPVEFIHFEIANLKSFNGQIIERWKNNTRFSHRGRLIFEAGNHRIVIDKSFSFQKDMNSLRGTGGYLCLYTGSIVPTDGGNVPFGQLNNVLDAFTWFLQFINGRRTSPLFRRGMFNDHQIVGDYRPFTTDQYKFVTSWASEFLYQELETIWPAFWTLYQDENDRECLTTALHWYVEANSNAGFVEGSVVLVQNGLEMLWNWCEEKGIICRLPETTGGCDEPFSGKLTRLLKLFDIQTNIPATLGHLTEFCFHQPDIGSSGPVVLTFIRNAYVHADARKRARLRAYPSILIFEAVQLAIWYKELILLRLLGYQDRYYNRTTRNMVELHGIEWVPWSEGAKLKARQQRDSALLTREEFNTLQQIIAEKASGLQQHEQKNFAKIGLDISNYLHKQIEGRDFIIIGTRMFRTVIDNVLARACEHSPEKFGKKSTALVLQALFDEEVPPLVKSVHEFGEMLRTENFAWISEVTDGKIVGDILRVDLFRDIKKEKNALNGEDEFIGGVFHAFRHFCFRGTPLSTLPDHNELNHPTDIYEIIIRGFFLNPAREIQPNAIISKVTLTNKQNFKFVFYHETNNDVYFIKTIYRQ